MAMRKRKIKFALEMKDGEQVRDLEALQEHFDLEKVIGYFQDGKLLEWLRDRFYDDEADAVSELNGEDSDLGMRLCEIFHVESKGIEVESPEAIAWRNERLEQLKQYTADPEILRQVDVVAFNQDDLEEILHEEDTNVVYLCQNNFTFPSGILRKENMRYVGIVKGVKVTLQSKDAVDLEALGIMFENVELSGHYRKTTRELPEDTKATTEEYTLQTELDDDEYEDDDYDEDDDDNDYYDGEVEDNGSVSWVSLGLRMEEIGQTRVNPTGHYCLARNYYEIGVDAGEEDALFHLQRIKKIFK